MGKYSENHTLYYNDKGEEVPSATTLLKIINKPSLSNWANMLGFKRLRVSDVLNERSEFGTLIHEIISAYIKGNYYIYCNDKDIPKEEIYGALNNFLKWYNNNTIECIFSEESFSSDLFGGTIDFYGKVNGLHTIVDFKTSKQIRFTMFIQLALYTKLLEEKGYKVEQVGIVLCNERVHDTKFISREELNPYIDLANTLIDIFHKYYNLNEKDRWGENLK